MSTNTFAYRFYGRESSVKLINRCNPRPKRYVPEPIPLIGLPGHWLGPAISHQELLTRQRIECTHGPEHDGIRPICVARQRGTECSADGF